MRYSEFREAFKDFAVLSLGDIRRIDSDFYGPRLNEWQKKGYLKKLTRGFYVFSDLPVDEGILFEISNKIYAPSYVSLQMALAYYDLIPESVYGITAIAARRTYRFKTPLAEFVFRSIKTDMFFGYDLIEHRGRHFKIASAEKALLDYLYLNPLIRTPEDFAGMRINREAFSSRIDRRLFVKYALRSGQTRLSNQVKSFLEFIDHA